MQVLADRAGIELPKQEMTGAQKREADKRTKLLEINKEAAKYFYKLLRSPRGEKAYAYQVFQYLPSNERYCTASATCVSVISPPPARSAIVRATFSTRV